MHLLDFLYDYNICVGRISNGRAFGFCFTVAHFISKKMVRYARESAVNVLTPNVLTKIHIVSIGNLKQQCYKLLLMSKFLFVPPYCLIRLGYGMEVNKIHLCE